MKRKRLNEHLIKQVTTKHVNAINDTAASFLLSPKNKLDGLADKFDFITAEDTASEAAEFIQDAREAEIQIERLYCNKTGRPIGIRDNGEIELLLKLHPDIEPFNLAKYINVSAGCSPAWIQTDSETLDKLQEADPRGYFMYAVGLICTRLTSAKGPNHRRHFTSTEYVNAFNVSLAEGYQLLLGVTTTRIIEANELLRKLLTLYHPKRVSWPFHWPDEYASVEGIDFLFQSAERKIREIALHEHDFATYLKNDAIATAVKKSGGGTGFSHIGGQRKDKGDILSDVIAKAFIEVGLHFVKASDGSVSLANNMARTNYAAIERANELRKKPKGNKLHTANEPAAGTKFKFKTAD